MAEKKKLSKKTLAKSFRNWSYGNLTCFSQEHMQTFGYLCAMLPIVEELYDTPEEQKQALQTYSAFFNTEPQIGTMIVGVTAGLEEARANGEAIDDDAINGIRAGLMGPLAGLGDSLIVGTLIPILLGIALGLSTGALRSVPSSILSCGTCSCSLACALPTTRAMSSAARRSRPSSAPRPRLCVIPS